MAGVNHSIISAMLLLGGILLMAPKTTTAIYFPAAPTPLREPRPGYFKFLDECTEKITEDCAKQFFSTIFISGTTSDECCRQLVLEGQTCHDEFVKYISHGPQFKDRVSEYWAKSEELYKRCVALVDPPVIA